LQPLFLPLFGTVALWVSLSSAAKIIVYAPDVDREVMRVTRAEADRMVARGQAYWRGQGHRELRLAHHYEIPPEVLAAAGDRLTHTSRGALYGAIGRSQKYVIDDNRGRVTGFKYLAPQDRPIFQAAALGLFDV